MTRKHDAASDLYECSTCEQMQSRASFTKHRHCLYGLNPVCRSCTRIAGQKRWAETREAQRAKRAALAPVAVTPKPKPEQRPLVHGAARMHSHKPPADYPVDDPALCVFPGSPCEAQDGFALVNDLFAANSCGGVVRGFAATVSRDAVGLVTPFFARKESAALWSALIRGRCGQDETRAAA